MQAEFPARALLKLCAIFAAFHVVFSAVPQIDLWLSGVFWTPEVGFSFAKDPVFRAMRELLLAAVQLMALLSLIGLVAGGKVPGLSAVPRLIWGRIALLYLLGPILLVNLILKEHWGRARPAHILEFGGEKHFTPAFQIAQECGGNCSFVSGEAAGATAFAVAVFWISSTLPARYHAFIRTAAIVFCVFGAGLRLVMGRHFASDVVFGVLLTLMIACVVRMVLKSKDEARAVQTPLPAHASVTPQSG